MLDFLFGSSKPSKTADCTTGACEKPTPAAAATKTEDKPKPCCVCKPEKSIRDECMLNSKTDTPERECQDVIVRYKECMRGYGFTV